jgi:hypothetical protein
VHLDVWVVCVHECVCAHACVRLCVRVCVGALYFVFGWFAQVTHAALSKNLNVSLLWS